MKLSDFKKDLKAVGVTYRLVRARTESKNLEIIVEECVLSHEVVDGAFAWSNTPEGFGFWDDISTKLTSLCTVAKEGSICDYSIEKSGKNWIVGCQTITPKQRLKLFKLLADDLGYKLED